MKNQAALTSVSASKGDLRRNRVCEDVRYSLICSCEVLDFLHSSSGYQKGSATFSMKNQDSGGISPGDS